MRKLIQKVRKSKLISVNMLLMSMFTQASADGFGEDVTINVTDTDPDALASKVIGIALGISKYIGIFLLVIGIYELIISYTQNRPEEKIKGFIMMLAGVILIGLKSILTGIIF